jgi:hypothetical protein
MLSSVLLRQREFCDEPRVAVVLAECAKFVKATFARYPIPREANGLAI